jgi:hypothetical protein
MPTDVALRALAERWAGARAAERANFQTYLIELCEALGVERPGPAGSGYEFELPVKVITKDGVEVVNFLDCHRTNYFAIEAKDEEPGRSTELLLRKAFGQLRHYASHAPGGLPPYLIVMDVARSAIVWDRWNGSYGDWQAGRRIDLTQLAAREDDTRFLQAIWTDPESLNPRARAQAVTKEVAGYLANLARSLEDDGYEQERVARFIMRCVFTMFAEDIGLLADEPFRQILERCVDDPKAFEEQAVALWQAMDSGAKFEWKKLMRFNGHFFRDSEALPLTKHAIMIMRMAADADWQDVEPAIFGTLLTRALDPEERHRLGAEFTPREFVERVVVPTVEEPIRERWRSVQAAVLQASEAGKKKDAEKKLREFHGWMKELRFLDPACGSGNFLYVTMHLVKRIELEVLRELDAVTGKHELLFDEVHPKQFFGIEIKPWAREIAELVLWIGYHQFWRAHHTQRPLEPILQDTGTIECRDALLAWDEIRHDPTRDRPDPTPRIVHPVTGKLVPDPNVKLEYMEYVNPRQAEWPKADFIVGNPPYMGQWRQREELGDGYVNALRKEYDDLPDTADYVTYWWARASNEVAAGTTLRAGLITTNSLTQPQNRVVISRAREAGVEVVWAVSDHPWISDGSGADVRVAMTVLAKAAGTSTRVEVDGVGIETTRKSVSRLNSDLTAHADVATASTSPLRATEGLCSQGFKLHGAGFILSHEDAQALLSDERNRWVVRPYVNGRDLTGRTRGAFVIDFGLMEEDEARAFALAFDRVRDRVQPERAANRRESYVRYWWRFGEPRPDWRDASKGLQQYVATVETSKHRFFCFLDGHTAPDNKLTVFASTDPFHLGVLSSTIHVEWALAAGGRLGVGNDPVYVKTRCFDSFPFPEQRSPLRNQIISAATRLDHHRRDAIARDDVVTMTGMYNVVEKLRTGEPLTEKERKIHEIAACGVLRDLHDELDVLVAKAYGWEWPLERDVILERLVALHDERVREEKAGKVRWLRPDYQIPRFGQDLPSAGLDLADASPEKARKAKRAAWPSDVISQIGAIKRLLARETLGVDEIVAQFTGAKLDIVRRHLDILTVMGEVQQNPDGRYQGAT